MTSQISDYAVLAMQSYDFLDEDGPDVEIKDDLKVNYNLEGFGGWILRDEDADSFELQKSGFSAELFEKNGQFVISLRGTDDWLDFSGEDWIGPDADLNANSGFITGQISTQLILAVKYVEEVLALGVSLESITFTGHSLGGGLASALAALYDRPAYVFDPAPINTSVDVFDFLAFTESIRGVVASFITNETLENIIGDVAYSKVVLNLAAIGTTLASIGGEPLLKGMASFDWTGIGPSNWLDNVAPLPPLPEQPDLVEANLEELLDWVDAIELYEFQLTNRYQQLLTFAEQNVAVYAVDGEVLQEMAAPFAGAIPDNNGTELIDIGKHELSAVDLHSQPLLALTQVRSEDGKNIVADLFENMPGLVDNMFNSDLTGFYNHKGEIDYTIFMRMLMDISNENDHFYQDFFTEYKRIADTNFSNGRNPVSEYFVQSGLIELGERVRQDTDNDYLEGELGAPGAFFGVSENYLYQQTFQHPESAIQENVETLDSYIYNTLSISGYWAQFEAAYSYNLFFEGTSPSDDLTAGFDLYNSFRAIAVAISGSSSASLDIQATLGNDQASLETLTANEDPNQKTNQGWFLLGSLNGADTVTGSDKSDLIITQGGEDVIKAGAGDDVVLGGDGKDELDGEDGNDVLVGGADDDTFIGSKGNDLIFGGDVASNGQGGVDTADFTSLNQSMTVSFFLENAGLSGGVTAAGDDV
ncbi:hypothetical protein [Labrenzia sp. OB1]|uniref:hypothetical protein n=1 Tax=Labrenzia sp. OB1 TaxID=1561204 RepID=UPI00083945B3|nr:hypothetical protein [Labrenzia sp. OB1]